MSKVFCYSTFMWVMLLIVVGLWSFIIGQLSTSIVSVNGLEDVYKSYNHIQIYEDGSYVGQTTGGLEVSGCIKGGLCDDTNNK